MISDYTPYPSICTKQKWYRMIPYVFIAKSPTVFPSQLVVPPDQVPSGPQTSKVSESSMVLAIATCLKCSPIWLENSAWNGLKHLETYKSFGQFEWVDVFGSYVETCFKQGHIFVYVLCFFYKSVWFFFKGLLWIIYRSILRVVDPSNCPTLNSELRGGRHGGCHGGCAWGGDGHGVEDSACTAEMSWNKLTLLELVNDML